MGTDGSEQLERLIERAHLAMLRADYVYCRELLLEAITLAPGDAEATSMLGQVNTRISAQDIRAGGTQACATVDEDHKRDAALARQAAEDQQERFRELERASTSPYLFSIGRSTVFLMPSSAQAWLLENKARIPICIGAVAMLYGMMNLVNALVAWRQSGPGVVIEWLFDRRSAIFEGAQILASHAVIIILAGLIYIAIGAIMMRRGSK
jgi:hypothetical protein